MQRRLTIALALTALVSILLVGFGVLTMAQLGARSRAEDQVTRGLNVVTDFLGSTDRSDRQVESLLFGSRANLGLDFTEPIVILDDGTVRSLTDRQRRRGLQAAELPELSLDQASLDDLDNGDTVLINTEDGVFGVRSLGRRSLDQETELRIAILAGQRVTAVSGQTVAWFLGSSLVVLVGALLAGVALARRLTGPIKDIQDTTSAIAGGDLAARVETTGSDEVAELGEAVNNMAADLQRSKALDRQFLMSVSHDLKTPLTAIAGYAEGLSDGAVTDPKAAGGVIANHAKGLERLVGDLLDLARLDANRFRLAVRSFDLSVVTGRTIAGLSATAGQHGIDLIGSGSQPTLVTADPDRTAQAIGNLIDNAVKFARSKVEVEVAIRGEFGVVSVSDDGPGIADADLGHIFDRLYTGKAQPDRAENPTGLGLAIVRELAHAMGGEVAADNNPGGGARLSLSLPLGSDPPGDDPTDGTERVQLRPSVSERAAATQPLEQAEPRRKANGSEATRELPPLA